MAETVLIVDDSLTVRMDLADAFEESGYATRVCASLGEARQALAEDAVDLIILDVLLPDGDGIEFLQELRQQECHLPVLLLSTHAEVKDRIRGLKTGAEEYVGKPYDREYVVARTQQLLGRQQESTSPSAPLILLVDDSPTVCDVMTRTLEKAGYRVVTASTGEEGLRLAARLRPAAMVVDGELPGIDGSTVIRRVRMDAALRHIACLMITGAEEGADERRILDAGADAFVRKQEPLDMFVARLKAVLRASDSQPSEANASLAGPKKILAVDDSQTYLHELAWALAGEGYDVVLAHSGEEALELLAVQAVDTILLDLVMPGIGGRETCRRIKETPGLRDVPLIMITSMDNREAMIEGLQDGADDYIAKSADFEVLRARLRAQLRRKQFEDEKRRIVSQLQQREMEASQARAAQQLATARAVLIQELEVKNKELEAFGYTVSHDLRAPLRSIDGFAAALESNYGQLLDDQGQHYLRRVRLAAQRMSQLIDDLLNLSRIASVATTRRWVDLSQLARDVAEELQAREPERMIEVLVQPDLKIWADAYLLTVLLENLIGNARKFTSRREHGQIEVGRAQPGEFFVRDNGAGFDMAYADKLFAPFQRLHSNAEFEGTGVGLATVQRIVNRHHGKVRAEGKVGEGACIYFALGLPHPELPEEFLQ